MWPPWSQSCRLSAPNATALLLPELMLFCPEHPSSGRESFARDQNQSCFHVQVDLMLNLSFLYGMWALLHGRWCSLRIDLPHTWWLLYLPSLWNLPGVTAFCSGPRAAKLRSWCA